MKKFALSAAAIALCAGSAFAADLPSRKAPPMLPPPPPPPAMWTGFYVGLNAGYGWSDNSAVNTVASPVNPFPGVAFTQAVSNGLAASAGRNISGQNGGFAGGGQIGYNYQFYHSFVAGIEADIQGFASSGGARTQTGVTPFTWPVGAGIADSYVSGASASRSIDYIGTVRGRLGWLATPTLLVYGTGGLAYGGVNVRTSYFGQETLIGAAGLSSVLVGASFSDTRVGWAAGGGVEWMFLPNWSAKVEYLHFDLGSVTSNTGIVQVVAPGNGALSGVPIGGAIAQSTTHFNGNIVRAGLNYHFNWGAPAPVVAKY
jgi:outer membrane immunogenic protein